MSQEEITVIAPAASPALARRNLMRNVGLGAVSAAAVGALAAGGLTPSPARAQAAPPTDVDILNFALNLEYLEAEFYLRAVLGTGLSSSDVTGTGTQGTVTGGSAVPFQNALIRQFATDIAVDEQAHVRFLRAALGSSAVAEPTIDLQTSFTNLAVAAGLISQGQTFNPFASEVAFLLGAFIFEDVGVTAYGGAARFITNPDYVEAAAGILAVEAYHAANIRARLSTIGGGQAVQAISNLRATLSGQPDDQGILKPNGNALIAPTDSNAITFRRSPRQVLNIVYFAQGAANGGFYPNGMNGTITS